MFISSAKGYDQSFASIVLILIELSFESNKILKLYYNGYQVILKSPMFKRMGQKYENLVNGRRGTSVQYEKHPSPMPLYSWGSFVGNSTGKVKNADFITGKRAHLSLYNLNLYKVISSYRDESYEVFRDSSKNDLADIQQTDSLNLHIQH